jgi:DnaJ-class molecular chaperone
MKKPYLYITYKKQTSTFYKFLGVEEKCTDEELKKAYRVKAREYHPDINPGDKAKEHLFKALQIIWDRLKTPRARAAYDADLAFDRAPQQQYPIFEVKINGSFWEAATSTTNYSGSTSFTEKDLQDMIDKMKKENNWY